MPKRKCGPRCARALALVSGLAYTAAAIAAAVQATTIRPELRALRWPILAADSAIFAMLAAVSFAGALVHPAALALASGLTTAYMLGNYDSQSLGGPVIAIAALALGYAYFKAGRGIKLLGVWRLVVGGAALALAVLSMVRMEEPGKILLWQRVTNDAGVKELRTYVFQSTCELQRGAAKDIDEIDRGCADIIPARRARFVIGFASAAALLAVGAVAGAPRRRRDEPGPADLSSWTPDRRRAAH